MSPRRVEGTLSALGGRGVSVNIKSSTGPKIEYRDGCVYSWSQYKMRVSILLAPMLQSQIAQLQLGSSFPYASTTT
jgi:hypothetical protein